MRTFREATRLAEENRGLKAEIDHLREVEAQLWETIGKQDEKIRQAIAENERLRDLLESHSDWRSGPWET